ncbi:MAG: hypothetical protein Marn2KO_33950 [Marinobacter nauticus]|uniref:hypothetical protein n=1 Tax=Marinobacter daepoensis TaxID=262077 RepID=UPI001C96B5E4|nr:hypothetical protein [Marinobacter daepoensis]MBY6035010.1 hypothetical protein [Marinobacter daepoensis]
MPTSVKIAVGMLSVVIVMGIWLIVKNNAYEPMLLLSGLIAPVSALIGILGVVFRRAWGRYLATFLIVFMGVGPVIALGLNPEIAIEALVFMAAQGLLFLWLAYAVFFGSPSKEYFGVRAG